jgi:dTDP-4-dehydrorhamnose reductase
MLGTDVMAQAVERGWEVTGVDRDELDITDAVAVAGLAAGEHGSFEVAINCAAYTAVDKAETESELAYAVNATGAGYLASACNHAGIRLIHVSTDFVFDGTKGSAHDETDEPNPLGVYAKSKLAGEEAVLEHGGTVVRTAWLFGPNGPSFPRTLIRAWRAGRDLKVVADQFGSPTYTGDLARVLLDLAAFWAPAGVFHAAGPTVMNWHELAVAAIEAYSREVLGSEIEVDIAPIRTEDWPTPTPRPAYSVLSFGKLGGIGIAPMRPMSEALSEFVRRLPDEL